MALEYSLYIKSKKSLIQTINEVTKILNLSYETEQLSESSILYTFTSNIGFQLNLLPQYHRLLKVDRKTYSYNKAVIFRMNKDYGPIKAKKNLVKFVIVLNEELCGQSLLLFNGEIVILINDKKNLFIADSEFWHPSVKSEVESIPHFEISGKFM